jgi:hypothetical protein
MIQAITYQEAASRYKLMMRSNHDHYVNIIDIGRELKKCGMYISHSPSDSSDLETQVMFCAVFLLRWFGVLNLHVSLEEGLDSLLLVDKESLLYKDAYRFNLFCRHDTKHLEEMDLVMVRRKEALKVNLFNHQYSIGDTVELKNTTFSQKRTAEILRPAMIVNHKACVLLDSSGWEYIDNIDRVIKYQSIMKRLLTFARRTVFQSI